MVGRGRPPYGRSSHSGTESSNPAPSSAESANHRFLSSRHERAALPLPPDAKGRDAGLIEGDGHTSRQMERVRALGHRIISGKPNANPLVCRITGDSGKVGRAGASGTLTRRAMW